MNVEKLIILGWQCAEDEDWSEAADYFTRARETDPGYAPAFLGLLCADLKVTQADKLKDLKDPADITNHKHYKRIVSDSDLHDRLDGYVQAIKARNLAEQNAAAEAERERQDAVQAAVNREYGPILEAFGSDAVIRDGVVFTTMSDIEWRVLKLQSSGKALLISEKVLESRAFGTIGAVYDGYAWEECTLRKYLDTEFYDKLGKIKDAIEETDCKSPTNPLFGGLGGRWTRDKVFLLSIDEVVEYFGDSGDLENLRVVDFNGKPIEDMLTAEDMLATKFALINDAFNSRRVAKNYDGKKCGWFLRSPGNGKYTAIITFNGHISLSGFPSYSEGGVRPAMWIDLLKAAELLGTRRVGSTATYVPKTQRINLAVGDACRFGKYDWRVLDVRDGKALLVTQGIIGNDRYMIPSIYRDVKDKYTWEVSPVRDYLNNYVYEWMGDEKSAIVSVLNVNSDNKCWIDGESGETLHPGGNKTMDRIFILDLEEVCRYFGDSTALLSNLGTRMNDGNDDKRVARDKDGAPVWWWLRYPGANKTGACVDENGTIDTFGPYLNDAYGGIRPALWLDLSADPRFVEKL